MVESSKKNSPRAFRRLVNVFKSGPVETKVEQEQPTHDRHQKKHKTKTKQEIQEVKKEWPFKPKKDQKISKAKVSLDDSDKIAEITKDDLWYFYQQFFLGTLSPSVQLKYDGSNPSTQLKDDESFANKERKNLTPLVLAEIMGFLFRIELFIKHYCTDNSVDMLEGHIRENRLSPEEFFNKFFDICDDFLPLDERFVLFFKELAKATIKIEKDLDCVCYFLECVLDELSKLPDPLIVFEESDNIFSNPSSGLFWGFEKNKEFMKECEKILLKCAKAKKPKGEERLQDKMKIFAESTFFKHSVLGKRSFYERVKELLPTEQLSMKGLLALKDYWMKIRSCLLENDEIKIVSFDERFDISEFPASWCVDRILQERVVKSFDTKMNDSLPKDPDLLKYFVFLVLTNTPSFFDERDSYDNLISFLKNLKKQDKAKIANIKIKLVEDGHSMLLPLPVFLCIYKKNSDDWFRVKDIIESLGLDVFNVKFRFDGEEHDIMSFLEKIQKSHPKEEDYEHLPVQEREFNSLFCDKENLHYKLKVTKAKLEIEENKEQTKVSSNQTQKSEKAPSTKVKTFGCFRFSKNPLDLNKKTKEEKTKSSTISPDTKTHVTELAHVFRSTDDISIAQ